MKEQLVIVICASALPAKPGCVPGYRCTICRKELQATAVGVSRIAAGGFPFCHAHGMDIVGKMNNISSIVFTPEFLETLAKNINTLASEASPEEVNEWMKQFDAIIHKIGK
jgi:hypothetical protein